MKKKKVTLIIEASSTGFGIYGEDFGLCGANAIDHEQKT